MLVAGLCSNRGASHKILKEIGRDNFQYVLSVPLFLEHEDVLNRPEFLLRSGLNSQDVKVFLDMLALKSIKTHIHYLWRPFLKDPKDDMVLELAVNGIADAIITFNHKDFVGVQDQFGVAVIRPADYYKQTVEEVLL